MVHFPETYSDDDDEDDEDYVFISSGLQHSLKIRNYGENKCSSSDEHVSSVVGGSRSITSKPDSFKSITKLSFNGVRRQPVLG
jgi:hypothetical protein